MSIVRRGTRVVKHRINKLGHARRFTQFAKEHPELAVVINAVRSENLTFLPAAALAGLADTMMETEEAGIDGDVIEAGAALGGSSIILGRTKSPTRPMRVYDTFGLIPPPSEKDGADVHARYEVIASGESQGIGGSTYYGYRENLLGEVRGSFSRFEVPADDNNVTFVKGLYQKTMEIESPVALAHLDCDWYESVMTCLERIEPHLVAGGRFVIDDYDAWSGARTAVDEFFAERTGYRFEKRSRLHIIKSG